jgi:hypothetical protein
MTTLILSDKDWENGICKNNWHGCCGGHFYNNYLPIFFIMKSLITILLSISCILSYAASFPRISAVNPSTDEISITNFGDSPVNISTYRLCSKLAYTSNLTSMVIVSGSLNLAAGQTVKLKGFALDDLSADLALYSPSGAFTAPTAMIDFVQWGGAGNGRESVAVAKGIWQAGSFLEKGFLLKYNGNGTAEYGKSFWTLGDCDLICVKIMAFKKKTIK